MSKFEQRAGIVLIEDLQIPLDFWRLLEPDYTSVDRREYVPGEVHRYWVDGNQLGGDLPWVDGDRYIESLETYRQLYAEHLADQDRPKTLEEAIAIRTAQLHEEHREKMTLVTMTGIGAIPDFGLQIDPISQALFTQTQAAFEHGWIATVTWKTAENLFYELSAAEFEIVASKIYLYGQAVYAAFQGHKQAIALSQDIDSALGYQAAAWPSTTL